MAHYKTAYIGLGSNLNNPREQINSALQALRNLPKTNDLCCSEWYGSKAIGPGDQPDYVNAAVAVNTQLDPFELLYQLQTIENAQGRQRSIRWGARTLDLDLLLYDDQQINSTELQLPHPETINRNFVLYPLNDLNADLVFPNGQTLRTLIKQCSITGLYQIDNTNNSLIE
ncbi:2-amino-4-hydroxy-6-hydroxymethyldihydropteridine diphosphokinase [Candidatus Endobugula sertula]|uniref:2-amino-4-hydroxy-6-hydroxymethyldihydropteridine pyrophosphokinase n=1 Tax=Candidatus Endobugula sertula TaxID=62101 RepID=A0A1D2QTB1_9GAMM|nr:2-amino-4-hydroxy-6-hydroxymethyldihydropteridine diphosphokinase [Candidatus Endobugula sertula]